MKRQQHQTIKDLEHALRMAAARIECRHHDGSREMFRDLKEKAASPAMIFAVNCFDAAASSLKPSTATDPRSLIILMISHSAVSVSISLPFRNIMLVVKADAFVPTPVTIFHDENVIDIKPWLERHGRVRAKPAPEGIQPFESVIREFLTIINNQAARAIGGAEPGMLQMSRLHPAEKLMAPQRFNIGDVDGMTKVAMAMADGGSNCYIEARTVRSDLKKGRGEAKDTERVFAFVIDSDSDKGKGAGDLPLAPSLIVESSPGNSHYWYFLDQAVRADQGKIIGEAIKAATGGDANTGVITQPYRVAGTPNFVDSRKRARGRVDSATKIYDADNVDRRYTPSELLTAFQKPATQDAPDAEHEGEFNHSWVKESLLTPETLNLIRNGVENDDRSRVFFSVVAQLKNRFWTLDHIVALFERCPHGIAKKYAGRVREETKRVFDKIKPGRDKLPIITVRKGDITKIVTESTAALHKAGVPLFSRGGMLVHPRQEIFSAGKARKTVVTTLNQYTPEALLLDVDRSAQFIEWKEVKGVLQPCIADPLGNIGKLMMNNSRHWRVSPITAFLTTPVVMPDGSVIEGSKAHYDSINQLYYAPSVVVPPIPNNLTKDDALENLQFIYDELLSEFPFVSDLDRAVALSAILTAIIRPVIPTAPLHAINAHVAGTGKSYLVDVTSMISTGELCAVAELPNREEELMKRLDAILVQGVPIVSFDNADHEAGGSALCQMTERPRRSVRILGLTKMVDLECRSFMLLTGNNLVLRGDMSRRSVLCNLDAVEERPELRKFTKNPVEMVRNNRGAYIAAALSVIKAYLDAGAPDECDQLGSYSDWSRMVRSPLVWLGLPDPIASMDTIREVDPVRSSIRQFLTSAVRQFGIGMEFRVRDVIQIAENDPDLKDVIEQVAHAAVTPVRVGKWLERISGNIVEGHRLRNGGRRGGSAVFYIERVQQGQQGEALTQPTRLQK